MDSVLRAARFDPPDNNIERGRWPPRLESKQREQCDRTNSRAIIDCLQILALAGRIAGGEYAQPGIGDTSV